MNKITIELCTEDRARIDRLTEALEAMAQQQPRTLYAIDLGSAPENGAQDEVTTEPTNTQPETEKPTQPEIKAPAVTVEDIRSKVLTLTGAGKKDEVRAIIKEYAEKVGDIPADKRAEVLEKLAALGG